ncbi:MAG TPA: fibronectin type III domain-containing protein [Candidatus Dojkabacteria bacterium]|nr:fibronectin type III domain-containing protein [Candidatus Dojkabacteria bacterium]
MKIDWKFVFKKSFSIVLKGLLIVTGLYLVSVTILSLVYRPMGVKVTNVTSSSATVSWYTDVPMTGEVSYKEKDTFLPLFLSGIGADKAYDDRDFAYAQKLCVAEFNMKLEKEVDEDFTVSGEDYNCDSVKVSKLGRYYVHHVTIKNLDEKKDYYFRVGNRVWGWKGDIMSFKTFETPENVKEPVPVFGRIVSSEGKYSGDSIVYGRFKDLSSGNESVMYSSVTNEDGGWYLDGGNLRGVDGEIVELSSGDDTFTVTGMYKNSKMSAPTTWVFGYFDGAYPDLKVTYNEKDNFLYKLVFGVHAGCTYANAGTAACNGEDLEAFAATAGYGKVAKQVAINTGEGELNGNVLNAIGLDDNAGNYSAIAGTSNAVLQNNYDSGNYTPVEVVQTQGGAYWAPGKEDEEEESGGESSGGTNSKPGDITVTTNSSGEWELDFNGKKITDKEDIEEILELTPAQQLTIHKCLEQQSSNDCSIKIEPVQVNIVRLVQINPEIETCIIAGTCNVTGLDEAIEQQRSALNTASSNYTAALSILEELRGSISNRPGSDIIDGNGITEPKYVFTGAPAYADEKDKIPEAWLVLFLKHASEDEKKLLLLQLGYPPAVIEFHDLNSLEIEYSGSQYKLSTEKGDLLNRDNIPYVMISEATYKKIENESGGVTNSNLRPGYKANDDAETIYPVDEDLILSLNKNLSEDELIKFAKEKFGINLSSDIRDGSFELVYKEGSVYAVYQEESSYEVKEVSKIPPGTITLDDGWNQNSPGSNSGNSGVVIVNKSDSAYEYLDDINNPAKKCYSVACPLETAKALLTSNPQAIPAGIIIACEADNKCYLKKIPTETQLTEQSDNIKKEIEKLNLLQQSLGGPGSFLRKLIVRTTFAAEDNTASEGALFFLPEYGMFSLQLGEFEFEKEISDGLTFYVFYLEVNGKEGFQMPVNPDSPTIHEDIMIKSRSFEINYEKKAEVKKYDLQAGINIISFDFVPVPTTLGAYTVSELVENARKNGTNIEYVSYFDGGRWVEGYKCTAESCIGSNFAILPGKGYVLKTSKKGSFTVSAYNLKSAIPLNLSAGWNLIGVHGYSSAYTAKSLINSINKVEGLTADNVSWYPTSKGRYEGLQVTEGVEYGFDFPINPMNGYFVRIKKFTPKDEACKSIIWHDGNDLNGTCGDSKSIF